ncbi:malonyl-CoA decarboxylase [Limnohabitans sp. JirII-29]|uniref:malonyl-CoA decarboxylase n=1 Tax=Limnohabitans sp. JirII-29 TaxID=1835756 RepID=UPI000D37EE78|nr:malonyl-CoA decarboxylase [Limnohabitans sp. JirII-29]PUE30295.1 malonyl-CoA decarboxylase [Limnohabitans sp. JirII-29]
MSATTWLNSKLNLLRNAAPASEAPQVQDRSTRERLDATLRHNKEALSPRSLRRTLTLLQAVVDPRVSEVEGGRRAKALAEWYAGAAENERHDLWLLISEQFGPDATKVRAARDDYDAALGTADEGTAEIRLRRALVSPRTRLLQRFAAYPGGMRFLVDLRAELLPNLKGNKRLLALDAELENLFSTWFDVAFLELRTISWDSPASLIEKLIKYEAVHDIRSWADLKNRLDSDRRCYGFFHPSLPNEPLIFVEVALLNEMADSIMPLLDEGAAPEDLQKSSVAIFYSISNTQGGLRGVSFGDSLIKRVVETLRAEFPKLKTFATLSPIPGLRSWLTKNLEDILTQLNDKELSALGREISFEPPTATHVLAAIEQPVVLAALSAKSPLRLLLTRCAAHYLGRGKQGDQMLDPVARFHLGNGARIERINWFADPSSKGIKQSHGLMVNYLYDLKRIDKHRQLLAKGQAPASGEVEGFYFS